MKPILVTSYFGPDLDGLACVNAYSELLNKLGRESIPGILGEVHEEAVYLLDRFKIDPPQKIDNTEKFDEIVLVDASELIGLERKISPEKVIEIIDHRQAHEASSFPNAKVQIELVGAAATLVAERFETAGVGISRESAILMAGAIVSNTLNFKAGVTTERDRLVYSNLEKAAKLSENFWRELFLAKSDMHGEKLPERIKSDFAVFDFSNKKIGIAQIEMIGAKDLIKSRKHEIVEILDKMKETKRLDQIFLSTIELENDCNYFIAKDKEMQGLLTKTLGIEFIEYEARRPGLILRKQIVPLLRAEFSGEIKKEF